PAVFQYEPEGITITFPDFPGCISEADSDEEAVKNAQDALASRLFADEEDRTPIPEPMKLVDIPLQSNERAVLIEVYMPIVRAQLKPKYVKRTVTLPEWLNIAAEKYGFNFSRVLQEALKDRMNMNR
ncbi:MAG: type II toxin-antitoxin system HicB family antitoxin, partial [Armatimonadota bacterium]